MDDYEYGTEPIPTRADRLLYQSVDKYDTLVNDTPPKKFHFQKFIKSTKSKLKEDFERIERSVFSEILDVQTGGVGAFASALAEEGAFDFSGWLTKSGLRGVTQESALESIKEGVLPSEYALSSLIAGTALSMHKFQRNEHLTYMRKMLSLTYEQTQTQRQMLTTLKAIGLGGMGSSGWEGGFFSRIHTALQRQTASAIASTIREIGKELTGGILSWLGKRTYLAELFSGGTTFSQGWHNFKQNLTSALTKAERWTIGLAAKTRLRPFQWMHAGLANSLAIDPKDVKQHRFLDALVNKAGQTIHAQDQNAAVKFFKKMGGILGKNLGNYGSSEQLDGTYRTGGSTGGGGISTNFEEKTLFYQRGMLSYLKEIRDALYVKSRGGFLGLGKSISSELKTYGSDEEFQTQKMREDAERQLNEDRLRDFKLDRLKKQEADNNLSLKDEFNNLTSSLREWWNKDHKWQAFKDWSKGWLKKRWENITKDGAWGATKKLATMAGMAGVSTFFLSSALGLPLWATIPLTGLYQAVMRSHTQEEIQKSMPLRGLQTLGKTMSFLSMVPFLAHPGVMWGGAGAFGLWNALRRQSASQYEINQKLFLDTLDHAVQDLRALPLQLIGMDKTAAGLSTAFMTGAMKQKLKENYQHISKGAQLLVKQDKTDDEYAQILKDYGKLKDGYTPEEFAAAKAEYQRLHEVQDMRNAGTTLNWLQQFKKENKYTDEDLSPEAIKAQQEEMAAKKKSWWHVWHNHKVRAEYAQAERERLGRGDWGKLKRFGHFLKESAIVGEENQDRRIYVDLMSHGAHIRQRVDFIQNIEKQLALPNQYTYDEVKNMVEERNQAIKDLKASRDLYYKALPKDYATTLQGAHVVDADKAFLHKNEKWINDLQTTTVEPYLKSIGIGQDGSQLEQSAIQAIANGEASAQNTGGILAKEINGNVSPSKPTSHFKDITISATNVYVMGKKWKKGKKMFGAEDDIPHGSHLTAQAAAPVVHRVPVASGASAALTGAGTGVEDGLEKDVETALAAGAGVGGMSLLGKIFSSRLMRVGGKAGLILSALAGTYFASRKAYNAYENSGANDGSLLGKVLHPIDWLRGHRKKVDDLISHTPSISILKANEMLAGAKSHLPNLPHITMPTAPEWLVHGNKKEYFEQQVNKLMDIDPLTGIPQMSKAKAESIVRKEMNAAEAKYYAAKKKATAAIAAAYAAHVKPKKAQAATVPVPDDFDPLRHATLTNVPGGLLHMAVTLKEHTPGMTLKQAQDKILKSAHMTMVQKAGGVTPGPHKAVKISPRAANDDQSAPQKPSWFERHIARPASWLGQNVVSPLIGPAALAYTYKKYIHGKERVDDRHLMDLFRKAPVEEKPLGWFGKGVKGVKDAGKSMGLGLGLDLLDHFSSSQAVHNTLSMNHGYVATGLSFLAPEYYLGAQGIENTAKDVWNPYRTKTKSLTGRLENTGLMMAEDGAAGAAIGSFIPFLGTAVGAGIGAGVGAVAANADIIADGVSDLYHGSGRMLGGLASYFSSKEKPKKPTSHETSSDGDGLLSNVVTGPWHNSTLSKAIVNVQKKNAAMQQKHTDQITHHLQAINKTQKEGNKNTEVASKATIAAIALNHFPSHTTAEKHNKSSLWKTLLKEAKEAWEGPSDASPFSRLLRRGTAIATAGLGFAFGGPVVGLAGLGIGEGIGVGLSKAVDSTITPLVNASEQDQPEGHLSWWQRIFGSSSSMPNFTPKARPITSAQVKKNTILGMKFLIQKGLSEDAAAALIGNFIQESSLNPYAVGDSGWAWGLAQWHPDRQKNISKHFGKSIFKMGYTEQLNAALWEMKTYYPKCWKKLNTKGLKVKEYVYWLVNDYEMPAERASNVIARTDNAYGVLKLWNKEKPQTPQAANTDTPTSPAKGKDTPGAGASTPASGSSGGGPTPPAAAGTGPVSTSPASSKHTPTVLSHYADKKTHEVSKETKEYVKQVHIQGDKQRDKSEADIVKQTTHTIHKLTTPKPTVVQTGLGKKDTTEAVSQGTASLKQGIEETNKQLKELTKVMKLHNDSVEKVLKSQNKVTPTGNNGIVVSQHFTQHLAPPFTHSDLNIRRPRQLQQA